jgi:hypothetical protein
MEESKKEVSKWLVCFMFWRTMRNAGMQSLEEGFKLVRQVRGCLPFGGVMMMHYSCWLAIPLGFGRQVEPPGWTFPEMVVAPVPSFS